MLGFSLWLDCKLESDLYVKLFNPLTKAQISFPSLETMLTSACEYDEELFQSPEQLNAAHFSYGINKLFVIEVSPSNYGHDNELVVMALWGNYRFLSFAKHTDQSWTSVSIDDSARTQSVMRVGDHVFASNEHGAIVYWDVKEFNTVDDCVKPMNYSLGMRDRFWEITYGLRRTYLAKSGSDLLLVLRILGEVMNSEGMDLNSDTPSKTYGFVVYKVDPEDKTLVKIRGLRDAALFLDSNFSISVSDPLAPNSIYYMDDELEYTSTEGFGYDNGIFNVTEVELRNFFNGDDTRSSLCPPFLFIPHC